jgi:hypothetical protein
MEKKKRRFLKNNCGVDIFFFNFYENINIHQESNEGIGSVVV